MSRLRHFGDDADALPREGRYGVRAHGRTTADKERLRRSRGAMEGDGEGFETAVDPEFVKDVLDMIAHRGGADAEDIGYTRGAFAQSQVVEYFSFALAQR